MKREIKFRAWDNTFNVMLQNVVVWDSHTECIAVLDQPAEWAYGDKIDERMDLNFEGSVPEWYCFTGGFNIMQYTGLKDKNGAEIYEGDIVKTYLDYEYKSVVEAIPGGYIAEWPLTEYSPHTIEVIGNIYQNPELLSK